MPARKPLLREDRLAEAFLDAYILLSRGYPRRRALELIQARYTLNTWERLAVYHCIHPLSLTRRVRMTTRCPPGGRYAVDGYNVAVTLYCLHHGIPVVTCPDGYTRDVMGGWKPRPEETIDLLAEYLEAIRRHLSGDPIVYLDSRVSRSGVLASKLREKGYHAATSRMTDKSIIIAAERRGYTPVTSDIVVLERVGGCNHLTHYVLAKRGLVVDVPRLLAEKLGEVTSLWGVEPPWAKSRY